jgi:hypothetical protein
MWRINDKDKEQGCLFVEKEDARFWNNKGWGIFDCPNPIEGKRCSANVKRIKYWFVDIDTGSKAQQMTRVNQSPLPPSLLVESRNGFHLYWRAKGASRETWRAIVVQRLIPHFDADKQASDMSRLLRVPGYYHHKGDPFLVQCLSRSDVSYTEDEMLFAFDEVKPVEREVKPADGETFWGKVAQLDCADALMRLSGTAAVRGETYELRPTGSKGGLNIYVDGKGTSCWIDAEGKLGKYGKGAGVFGWLSYFGHSPAEVARIIKEVFPELREAT